VIDALSKFTVDPVSGNLEAQWINPDGNPAPSNFFYDNLVSKWHLRLPPRLSRTDDVDGFGFAGNVEAFSQEYPGDNIVPCVSFSLPHRCLFITDRDQSLALL